ncbi:unnamed protein product, partial [Arabidopsis halleri]
GIDQKNDQRLPEKKKIDGWYNKSRKLSISLRANSKWIQMINFYFIFRSCNRVYKMAGEHALI